MAEATLQRGVQVVNDGSANIPRSDRQGAALMSNMRGRFSELAERGALFMASLQAAVALSTLSATATGFILTNPVGSGKDLHVLDVCIAVATAPAGAAPIGLAMGLNSPTAVTQGTPLTVRSAKGGVATTSGVGLAASAATLPAAPVMIRPIGGGPVGASTINTAFMTDRVDGAIIVEPGCSLSLSYLTTAISVVAAMYWHEEIRS
jgi:hypothetical protein